MEIFKFISKIILALFFGALIIMGFAGLIVGKEAGFENYFALFVVTLIEVFLIRNLIKPKWKHSKPSIRKAAIERVTDQEVLSEIAKYDSDFDVCNAAIEKISDQKVFADVAKNATGFVHSKSVRKAALAKVTNQSVFIEVAKNDDSETVRKAAIAMVTDQSVLAEVAKNDENGDVRETAIVRITDQSVLAEVAKNDENGDVRETAIVRVTDQKVLAEVAINDDAWQNRKAARDKLTVRERENLRPLVLEKFERDSLDRMLLEHEDMDISTMESSDLGQYLRTEMIWKRKNDHNFQNMEHEFKLKADVIRQIGRELDKRGGLKLMLSVYKDIDGDRGIDLTWSGIGEWRG